MHSVGARYDRGDRSADDDRAPATRSCRRSGRRQGDVLKRQRAGANCHGQRDIPLCVRRVMPKTVLERSEDVCERDDSADTIAPSATTDGSDV